MEFLEESVKERVEEPSEMEEGEELLSREQVDSQ